MWAQAGSPAQSVAQRTRPNATATSRAAAGTRDSINTALGLAMPEPPATKRASPRRPPLARSDSSAMRAVWMAELQAEREARAERMPPAPDMPAAVREDDEADADEAPDAAHDHLDWIAIVASKKHEGLVQ